MPVALSRFARVMTGGKLVTDELVDVRDQKVGTALDGLQGHIDRLGVDGLRIKELEDQHANLSAARQQANSKGSNEEICEALEQVKFDARDAEQDAQQRVDAAQPLGKAKTEKLREVNAALRNAKVVVDGITDAALRAPLERTAADLARRRDELAAPAELDVAKAEVAKAPALMLDISKLETDAGKVDAVARAKAAKLAEVDTALGGLATALGTIAGAGFKDPAAAPLPGLTSRRDALANAADPAAATTQTGNAGALLTEIGTATTAAKRAAKAEADQQRQLTLVDDAMTALRTVETAIAEPLFKTPVTQSATALALRRDGLASANDVATAEAQVALAPALLGDISTAKTAADLAKVKAEDITRRKTAANKKLDDASAWIATIEAGGEKDALVARLDQLKLDRDALATTADPTALDTALTTLTGAADQLYRSSVAEAAKQKKANADLWVAAFTRWEVSIGKISANNPVKAETQALRNEKATADLIANDGARRNALSGFISKAAALQTKVENMQAEKTAIEKTGLTITALLTITPPASPVPPALQALTNERTTVLAGLPAAFNQPNTDAVMTRLGELKTQMLAIKPKAEDWRAAQLDIDKLKASVTKSLTDAEAAVNTLATGTEKTGFASELEALKLRRTATGSMAESDARKALFAIDKEAIALLERAHKLAFTQQLAAPDGKQKIDDLITSFGDKAADPQTEAVCRAAIAARFKLDVEVLEGLSVDRLPRLYNLFAQVPESHVGHDKLTRLEYNTDPASDASYYSGSMTKIVLAMPASDPTYPYKAQTGGAVENLNYFSATALHEIGHGVDEKQGIMSDARMAGAEFGGWRKETIDSVAQAHYTKSFASLVATSGPTQPDLLAMVKSVLETGACAQPASATAPLGSLFAKWTEITELQGFKDLAAIRNPGLSPWDKPVAANDRAYHEAYDGTWYSYLVAERSKGISNYQWRAPPEWFAEWYAYYHMTKKTIPASLDAYIKG